MQIKQPQPAGDGYTIPIYIRGMVRYSSTDLGLCDECNVSGTDKLPSYYVLIKGHDEAYLCIFPCVCVLRYTVDQDDVAGT